MKDEIKEVYLSGLEWTETNYDNMGGVMGNIVFKDNMSYEEYQKLTEGFFILCDKDYITNLQQENEKKDAYIKYLHEYNPKYYKGKKFYRDSKEELIQRIDEAIEYIEKDTRWFDSEYASIYGELCKCEGFNTDRLELMVNPSNLLDILKGDSNDEGLESLKSFVDYKERFRKALEYIEYINIDPTYNKVLLEILKGDNK